VSEFGRFPDPLREQQQENVQANIFEIETGGETESIVKMEMNSAINRTMPAIVVAPNNRIQIPITDKIPFIFSLLLLLLLLLLLFLLLLLLLLLFNDLSLFPLLPPPPPTFDCVDSSDRF